MSAYVDPAWRDQVYAAAWNVVFETWGTNVGGRAVDGDVLTTHLNALHAAFYGPADALEHCEQDSTEEDEHERAYGFLRERHEDR